MFYGHRKWQYGLVSGPPIRGYALSVYIDEERTTLAQLYDGVDAATASPVSNPLIGDSTGFVNIYGPTGVYWLTVTSNGGAALNANTGQPVAFNDVELPEAIQLEDSMDRWRGLDVFDPTTAYYGGKADGSTNDRVAWVNSLEDMGSQDKGVWLVPRGESVVLPPASGDPFYTFDIKPNADPPKTFEFGYEIMGYGPGASVIQQGDDWGNPIWDMMGRSAPNDQYLGPLSIGNFSHYGNGFTAYTIGGWQGLNNRVWRIHAKDVKGIVVDWTSPKRGIIEDLYLENCGDSSQSAAPIRIADSNEGGTFGSPPTGVTVRDIRIKNATFHGLYARGPEGCDFLQIRVDGVGTGCHGLYLLDPVACTFDADTMGGTHGVHVQSTGSATGNVVRGKFDAAINDMPGGGAGVCFFKGNEDQTHGPSTVDGVFGSREVNHGDFDVNVPLDGTVIVAPTLLGTSTASPRPNWRTKEASVADGETYTPDLASFDGHRITPASGGAYTVGPAEHPIVGEEFEITLVGNGSNTPTWDSTYKFPTGGNAKATPANGKEQTWRFRVVSGGTFKVVGGSGGSL